MENGLLVMRILAVGERMTVGDLLPGHMSSASYPRTADARNIAVPVVTLNISSLKLQKEPYLSILKNNPVSIELCFSGTNAVFRTYIFGEQHMATTHFTGKNIHRGLLLYQPSTTVFRFL